MGYLETQKRPHRAVWALFMLGMLLAGCEDVYLDPYGAPAPPVDLIITVSGIATEGATAEVYLGATGEFQSAIVSRGRFSVSFPSTLEAHQLYLITFQVFVDDNGDFCCDSPFDTLFGYEIETETTDQTVLLNVNFADPDLYPSDCSFFWSCDL